MLVRSVSGVALNKEKRGKNNMIRAIMSGCNGKMGQVITGICKEDAEIEIVAGIDLYDGIKTITRYSPISLSVMWQRM